LVPKFQVPNSADVNWAPLHEGVFLWWGRHLKTSLAVVCLWWKLQFNWRVWS
jgi:hypothetical protein